MSQSQTKQKNISPNPKGTSGGIVKRHIKATVFTSLFSEPEYQLQLYRALHPEDTSTTEANISNVTLQAVMVNDLYNDAGMIVGDKLLILVEAQSTWSDNIIIRSVMYAMQTLNDYFTERCIDIYESAHVRLPEPEFYVIFTGRRKKRPHVLSLSKTFFNGRNCALEAKVRIIYNGKRGDIINQYVEFTHIWDKQFRKYGRTRKALSETIKICLKRNILVDYLTRRSKEIMDIWTALYDQEEVTRRYHFRIRNEARNEGRAKDVVAIMQNLDCDQDKAMDLMNISMEERPEILKYIHPDEAAGNRQ